MLDPANITVMPGDDPRAPLDATQVSSRRHREWDEFHTRWRWLMDSFEGGQRYREAIYGIDFLGMPVRNLIRHKREYPEPREVAFSTTASTYLGGTASTTLALATGRAGVDQAQFAEYDDYELRRARTPVPTFVAEAIAGHLGEVYSKEISRSIPESAPYAALSEWMIDVDGQGTDYATWVMEDFAPLLLVLGQLDILFDHPASPVDQPVLTRADSERLGLDRCLVSIILPENMVWWRLDPITLTYTECLVKEFLDPDDPTSQPAFRHWTATGSTLYGGGGVGQKSEVISVTPHAYGRVPIVRIFDRRKPRCRNVGQSRYESIAERQREYYNRDSELILSDSTQAHPLLQGPEDFVQGDGSIPVGPTWLLPKKKNAIGGSVSYEGFEVVDFPKGTAESIRENMAVIRDDVDRDGAFTKPAGASGTGRSTVAQSGISKQLDAQAGARKLASIATSLARAETRIMGYALVCLNHDPDAYKLASEIEVVYPTDYNLFSASDLAAIASDFQELVASAGKCPETESLMLSQLARQALPGFDDETYERIEAEIRECVEEAAERKDQMAEIGPPVPPGTPGPDDEGGENGEMMMETPEMVEMEKSGETEGEEKRMPGMPGMPKVA
jgi:hypothetical protein